MHGMEILLLTVIAAFAQGSNSSHFPNWQLSWIMGGSDADPGEFPFMASLMHTTSNNHFCAGSIISNWYILTAAHCIDGMAKSSIIVVVGTNRLSLPGKRYGVSVLITHQLFHRTPYKNDIGLIRVAKAIVYSSRVRPVTLAMADERAVPRTRCMFMGWGYTSPSATTYSNDLQKLRYTIISNHECLKYYGHVTHTYICGDAGPGKGTCSLDSGGPLICGRKQVGVLSGGGAPGTVCSPPYPSLFTYLPKYVDWINMVTSTSF